MKHHLHAAEGRLIDPSTGKVLREHCRCGHYRRPLARGRWSRWTPPPIPPAWSYLYERRGRS